MQVHISKWGNSLGLRLPQALARQVGIAEGQKVEVIADGDRLVIRATPPSYTLKDLLIDMSPDAMRDAFDWGPDVGREVADD